MDDRVGRLRQSLERQLFQYQQAVGMLKEEKQNLEDAKEKVVAIAEGLKIVRETIAGIQERCHTQFACIVNRCLEEIFDDPYEFRIVFEEKRGRTEAGPVFCRDSQVLADPLYDVEGGVIDVAAFGLRLARVLLSVPSGRKLIILDEPFRNLHGTDYRERIKSTLVGLSKELGIQMVIMTQDDTDLSLGKVVNLE